MDKIDLIVYQKAGDAITELTDELKARKDLFDKNNEKIIDDIAKLNEVQTVRKARLTEIALSEYKKTKEKKLLGGIGIRETKKVSYSAEEAMDWAIANNMCLQLDKKKFEKVAPELVDFITTTKSPSVTFPKVLILKEDL